MIGADVKVRADGSVVGTFHYVTNFEEFNKNNPAEQEGHYFPFKLAKRSQNGKMTLKTNGQAKPEKTDMTYDPEIIFRISDTDSIFTVELDGEVYISLNFHGATLEPQA